MYSKAVPAEPSGLNEAPSVQVPYLAYESRARHWAGVAKGMTAPYCK